MLLSSSSFCLLHGKHWELPDPKSYQLLPALYTLNSKELLCILKPPLLEIHIAGKKRRKQVSICKTESFNENRLQGQPDYQLFCRFEKHTNSRKNECLTAGDLSQMPAAAHTKTRVNCHQPFSMNKTLHKLVCVILYITLKQEQEMKGITLLCTGATWNVKCTHKSWKVLP